MEHLTGNLTRYDTDGGGKDFFFDEWERKRKSHQNTNTNASFPHLSPTFDKSDAWLLHTALLQIAL